jgi:ribonuclease D
MIRPIEWIRETSVLRSHLGQVGRGPLSLDTEADSLHHYPEKVCLVQLSFGGADRLVDPLAGVDLSQLQTVLADPGVRKILHGADYDLRILHRDFGLTIAGLFDTMVAARLTGEREFGLAVLLGKHFGVELDKRHQRADWSQRPLPEALAAYAALDTRHLAELADLFEERLRELGRTAWAAEEFGRLEGVRWNERTDSDAFRRVKGSAGLSPRQLAVLRELVGFREQEARRRDRPPFRIARDEVLLAVVRSDPRSPAELARIPGFPRPWSQPRAAQQLLDVVRRALALPDSQLPEVRRRRRRPNAAFERRLREVMAHRDRLAQELDLEASIVASRGALEEALREPGLGDDAGAGLRRWQAALLRPELERLSE